MPSFNPTILINTTPAVSITTANPNLTYDMFRESLGDYAYEVDVYYVSAQSINQVMGVAQYNYLNADGMQRYISLTPVLDPNQFQAAVYYDTKYADIILNGNSQVSFKLLPNELISLTLYTKRISKQTGMEAPDNFQKLGEAEGMPKLFGDWNESI